MHKQNKQAKVIPSTFKNPQGHHGEVLPIPPACRLNILRRW